MEESVKFPHSEANLVVDHKKCAGCFSCMMACALVHEGEENLALARIQIMRNIFDPYSDDIAIAACRQCVKPQCVIACPNGACHVDEAHGNVRVIDQDKCDGCGKCLEACPFVPQMPIWNPEKKKASKCDLCVSTPYWSEKGGPDGKQACVSVCPTKAIELVKRAVKTA